MLVEQIYTGCLAQATYYIESKGEAAIIDPLRDIDTYLQKAKANNVTVKYIFETHFHADFVSGHVDLANATGAEIVYGPTAKPAFKAITATDNQEFKIGGLIIRLLHTPGHTMESCCYLLIDENGKESMLFSGDTLFLGDVGRPDLAQKAANMTQEELAGLLYDSLQTKIMPLSDDIIVYPAHGAGSACGKNMSKDTSDTLGHQKATNYALRAGITRAEFIQEVLTGLTKPPQYFPLNVMLNKQGYENIEEVIKKGTTPLSVAEVEKHSKDSNVLLLDARKPQDFGVGHIPGAINIGINGDFAPWVGTIIKDINQQIVLITDVDAAEVVARLSRVGYDHCIGYLDGGMQAWTDAGKPVQKVESINADELATRLETHPVAFLLDVRRKSEYDAEHVIGAENVPLNYINENNTVWDKDTTYYVHCAAGYRSMIFISLMQAKGYDNFIDVQSGFKAIKESGRLNTSHYVEPITML
eukprot:Opistho-1_new@11241